MGQIGAYVAAILIAVAIIGAVGAAATVAGIFWLRRVWRRRRAALAFKVSGVAVTATAAGFRWLSTRPAPDRRWWLLHRARRDLLRAATGAEHAVREAKAAGAPLGDLEGLSRRVRRAAIDVDRSLRIAQHSEGTEATGELVRHAQEVATAARRIQRTAAESLNGRNRDATDMLVRDARLEEQATIGVRAL
jgi:hypothetical protein